MQRIYQNFSEIELGQHARILKYIGPTTTYHKRLISLGLTPGTEFKLLKVAPLGDPIEIAVRGFRLSLRRNEAACLEVERV
ncbi:MAG: FeoA family protein [Pseudomonadales bacterium]|jgi:Fe2+ transport system protein FeoA|nr:FeoA family protein [Pseudomonadales bacterium]MDP7359868.1 FeoA family protein [Pseudomonadales bacterium]MDP7594002.1 FeoA family protein [Pseudomonadales bacterium]HJN48842.1 FeoA family protein [Pseudomonadales bacterium]|tara:strand:- start:989 stop:1231 length:243 start_codon:yes stop_codon:yes gene_type:complete